MKLKNVMLDIETWDSELTARVLSIGAVFFDRERLGDTFYAVLNQEQQRARGRTWSNETWEWWQKQSPAAFAVIDAANHTPMNVEKVLTDFATYLGDGEPELWGNGSDFDNAVVASLYKSFAILKPWSFRKNRCYRTLKNIAIMDESHKEEVFMGTAHNALDDALYQARCAMRYLNGRLKNDKGY